MTDSHELVIEDLTVSYDRVPAIHHVSLRTRCGRMVALVGPNGAGKSTLLKAIAGLAAHETGSIFFHGRPARAGQAAFAYLPQRGALDWDFPITVRGLVETGRYAHLGAWRAFGAEDAAAVDRALAAVGIADFARRPIGALSGGQQQRALIARALAQQAHVLLLDEPFTGLDRPTQEQLEKMLRDLAKAGHLIIAAEHNLDRVRAHFDAAALLNGELIAFGAPAEALGSEQLARAFGTPVFSGTMPQHVL